MTNINNVTLKTSYNIHLINSKCSDMRVHTTAQCWALQVKYKMTSTFSSLRVFGTDASLLRGQRAQTRAPFTSSSRPSDSV